MPLRGPRTTGEVSGTTPQKIKRICTGPLSKSKKLVPVNKQPGKEGSQQVCRWDPSFQGRYDNINFQHCCKYSVLSFICVWLCFIIPTDQKGWTQSFTLTMSLAAPVRPSSSRDCSNSPPTTTTQSGTGDKYNIFFVSGTMS